MKPNPISVHGASYAKLAALDKLLLRHDLERRSRTLGLSHTGEPYRAPPGDNAPRSPVSAAGLCWARARARGGALGPPSDQPTTSSGCRDCTAGRHTRTGHVHLASVPGAAGPGRGGRLRRGPSRRPGGRSGPAAAVGAAPPCPHAGGTRPPTTLAPAAPAIMPRRQAVGPRQTRAERPPRWRHRDATRAPGGGGRAPRARACDEAWVAEPSRAAGQAGAPPRQRPPLGVAERLPRRRESTCAGGTPSRLGWGAPAWNDALPERQGLLAWERTSLGLPPAPVVPNNGFTGALAP
jgi:hypothetical protein